MKESAESFDHKRELFWSKLKEFYSSNSLSSEDLIARRNEIDFLGHRLTDVLFSAAAGAIMGLLITAETNLFQVISQTTDALTNTVNVAVFIMLLLLLWGALIGITKFSARLTSYQKFHFEKAEIDLIEEALEERQINIGASNKH